MVTRELIDSIHWEIDKEALTGRFEIPGGSLICQFSFKGKSKRPIAQAKQFIAIQIMKEIHGLSTVELIETRESPEPAGCTGNSDQNGRGDNGDDGGKGRGAGVKSKKPRRRTNKKKRLVEPGDAGVDRGKSD